MKKIILIISITLSLIGLTGCSGSQRQISSLPRELPSEETAEVWPEDLIHIETNLAESQLAFKINSTDDEPIYYRIYYNNQIYKSYTKTEKEWHILYDYSFKDVTKVTIRADGKAGRKYEKSVLVVIDPKGYDFSKNELEVYYASRYEMNLKEIASLSDQLVSVEVEGNLITGDISDFENCKALRRLNVIDCPYIKGEPKQLNLSKK